MQISAANTDHAFASRALRSPWVRGGGDWSDANGVLNGLTPVRSFISQPTTTVDISGIDGDLILTGANIESALIDGLPAGAFWVNGSSNRSWPLPTSYMISLESHAFVLNPGRGKVLTLITSAQPGHAMTLNKVRGPAITELPMLALEGALPPDLGTMADPITYAVVNAALGVTLDPNHWAYDPSNGIDPDTGIAYLRFAGTPANQKLIAWRWGMRPRIECYLRYCLWFEDSIADGMTEQGVKLPGFESVSGQSWRLIQGPPDQANRHIYALGDYIYSAETPPAGYGDGRWFGQHLRTGRWYVFEEHVKRNTFTNGVRNPDGIAELWMNGHLVAARQDVVWSVKESEPAFDQFFVNVYHGGMGFPARNIYYRIAKLARSTTRIGPPRELL